MAAATIFPYFTAPHVHMIEMQSRKHIVGKV